MPKPAVRLIAARRAPAPGRAAGSRSGADSSLSQLPPTAIPSPSATPDNTRPTISHAAESGPVASTSEPATAMNGAGIISGRRPNRSDSGPPISSAGTMPSTYANRKVSTTTWVKPWSSLYITSRGVNSLPPHATANIPAATSVQCRRRAAERGSTTASSLTAVIAGSPLRARGPLACGGGPRPRSRPRRRPRSGPSAGSGPRRSW